MLDFLFTATPLKFFVESLWRDEAYSYLLAKRPIFEMFSLTAKDFNPPLYYFILHYWTLLFGHTEVSIRTLSLVFFCALLYVMHLFMEKIFKFSTERSYRYLIFVILSPILVYYAFEARMYMMLTFFASLSCYAFWRRDSRMYYIATVLGLYTHYFMVLILVFQGIIVLLYDRKNQLFESIRLLLLPTILFVPWGIFVLLVKTGLSEAFWIMPPPYKDFLHIPGIMYTGYERGFDFFKGLGPTDWMPLILYISAIVVLICSIGYYSLYKKKSANEIRLFQFLLLWGFFPPIFIFVLSYIFKPLFLPRYLILSVPGLVLAIVYALKNTAIFPRVLLIILLTALSLNYHSLQIRERKRDDFSKTFREINHTARKDDVVYVTDVLSYFVAGYYFDEKKVYVYGLPYSDIPSYVGKVLIPPDRVVFQLPTYPKRAFVLEDYQTYSVQSKF